MQDNPKNFRPANHKALVERFRPYNGSYDYDVALNIEGHSRTKLKSGVETFTGEWTDAARMHLLKRTMFGPTKSELRSVQALGMQETVDLLLTEVPLTDTPINNYNDPSEGVVDPNTGFGQSWIEAPYDNEYEGRKILSLKGWIIKNMMQSPLSMHHKLTFFWHNLLVTQFWDIFQAKASYQYYLLLHQHAFGNFKTLIKEITRDPAMLIYLNGARNNKEAPDENYARELQELFCIGKGPDSGYTEADVQAAARVLTGWTVDGSTLWERGKPASGFYPPFHETANKQFSEFYDQTEIAGKSGEAGAEELDDLLDMIFNNEETARYICRRLYNFFVYPEIDEETEINVIRPLAQVFRDGNYEIKPVLDSLLKSAHFHDEGNYGVMIKNPIDFLLSTVRTVGNDFFEGTDLLREHRTLNSLIYWGSVLGMEIGDPPSVAGWPAYYQTPQFDKSWITTDSITKRAQLTDMSNYAFYASSTIFYEVDLIRFVSEFETPEDPNELIAEASILMHGIPLGEKSVQTLKSILLAGQQEDYHWRFAWNDHVTRPDNPTLRNVVENRLRATFQALMQQGEFHLM